VSRGSENSGGVCGGAGGGAPKMKAAVPDVSIRGEDLLPPTRSLPSRVSRSSAGKCGDNMAAGERDRTGLRL